MWKYLIFLQTKLPENFIFYQRMSNAKIDRGFFSTMTIEHPSHLVNTIPQIFAL